MTPREKKLVEAVRFAVANMKPIIDSRRRLMEALAAYDEPTAADQPSITESIEAAEDKNSDIEGGR